MNKKTYTLIVIVLSMIILFGGSYLLYNQFSDQVDPDQIAAQDTGPSASEPEKQLAPDFTVYDEEGNAVHLSDFIGKPVVLNFWASWCGPCKMEMPDFDAAYQKLGDQIQFLMVNATDGKRETVETATQFIEDNGYTFPVFFDRDTDALMNYSIFSFPTTFFIDAEGYIVSGARGALTAERLQAGIDLILK